MGLQLYHMNSKLVFVGQSMASTRPRGFLKATNKSHSNKRQRFQRSFDSVSLVTYHIQLIDAKKNPYLYNAIDLLLELVDLASMASRSR